MSALYLNNQIAVTFIPDGVTVSGLSVTKFYLKTDKIRIDSAIQDANWTTVQGAISDYYFKDKSTSTVYYNRYEQLDLSAIVYNREQIVFIVSVEVEELASYDLTNRESLYGPTAGYTRYLAFDQVSIEEVYNMPATMHLNTSQFDNRQNESEEQTFYLPNNIPEHSDTAKIFVGWSTTPFSSAIIDKDRIESGEAEITTDRNTTLYARWRKDSDVGIYCLPAGTYGFTETVEYNADCDNNINPNAILGGHVALDDVGVLMEMESVINFSENPMHEGYKYGAISFGSTYGFYLLKDNACVQIYDDMGQYIGPDYLYNDLTGTGTTMISSDIYMPEFKFIFDLKTPVFVPESVMLFFEQNAYYIKEKISGRWQIDPVSLQYDGNGDGPVSLNSMGMIERVECTFDDNDNGEYVDNAYRLEFNVPVSIKYSRRGTSVKGELISSNDSDPVIIDFGKEQVVSARFYQWMMHFATQVDPEDSPTIDYYAAFDPDTTSLTISKNSSTDDVLAYQIFIGTTFIEEIPVSNEVNLYLDRYSTYNALNTFEITIIPVTACAFVSDETKNLNFSTIMPTPTIELVQEHYLVIHTDSRATSFMMTSNSDEVFSKWQTYQPVINLEAFDNLPIGQNEITVLVDAANTNSINSRESNSVHYNKDKVIVVTLSKSKGYVKLDTKEKFCDCPIKVVLVD